MAANDKLKYEPLPRMGHISGFVDQKYIVQGGVTQDFSEESKQQLSSIVEVFDTSLEQWTQEPARGDLPKPGICYTASASSSDGCIYSFGGTDGSQYFNTLYKLDARSKSWTLLSPLYADGAPMPKSTCGMAVFGDSIVIVNGYAFPRKSTAPGSFIKGSKFGEGRGWTNELHIYSLSAGEWSCPDTSGEKPPPCSGMTFTAIDERRAVMFGGCNGEQGRMNDVYIFDISTMSWRRLKKSGSWPDERDIHAACCLSYGQSFPQLLMTGGWDRQSQPLNEVWILDVDREKWTMVTYIIKGRCHHSLVAINLAPGLTEVMQFGRSSEQWTDATQPKLADTTLFQFRLVESSGESQWKLISIADKEIGSQQRVTEKFHNTVYCWQQHSSIIEGQLQRTRQEQREKMIREWEVAKRGQQQEFFMEGMMEVEKERDRAKEMVVEVRKKINKVEEEMVGMRMAKERVEIDVQKLAREKKEIEYNLFLATNTINEKDGAIKELKLEQELQSLEMNGIKERARTLEEEKKSVVTQAALHVEEIQKQTQVIARERDTAIQEKESTVKAYKVAILQMKTKIENLQQLVQQQQERNKSLENVLDAEREVTKRLEFEANLSAKVADEKVKSLENELNVEREKYKRAEFERNKATEEAGIKIHSLQSQIVALQQSLQQAQFITETAQSKSEIVIESEIMKVEEERDMAKGKVVEVEAERDREKERVVEVEAQKRMAEKMVVEVEKERDRERERVLEMENKNKAVEEEREKLVVQLQNAKAKANKLQHRLHEVEMEEKKSIPVQEKSTQTEEPKKTKDDEVVQTNLPKQDDLVEEDRAKDWAIAEKMVTITNEEQDIEWKGYGLKLQIPQNSLPEDVSRSQLQITVSNTEDYQLPAENGILVSAIYSFNHSLMNRKLRKPLTVQIQHCMLHGSFTPLCLVQSNEMSPLFRFRALEDKPIDSISGYCSFELDHFCSFGVWLKWFAISLFWTLQPCAVLYYTNIHPAKFDFHLYVVPGLDAILTDIDRRLSEKTQCFMEGNSTKFEIDQNATAIKLALPDTPIDSWSFKHQNFKEIRAEEIKCMPWVLIPFKVRVKWSGDTGESIKELEYDVKLSESEGGTLTVSSPIECTNYKSTTSSAVIETIGRSDSSSGCILPKIRDFTELPPPTSVGQLMNVIGVKLQVKWRDVGLGLGLNPQELKTIRAQYSNPQDCMTEVFTVWETRETISWEKLANVITSDLVNEPSLLHIMWDRLNFKVR